MKKRLLTKTLLTAAGLLVGMSSAWAVDINATVKMTYVDYNNADTSFGEIAAGETAKSGYNKISGGAVAFVNTGWGVNYITYLQVDASAVPAGATITSAKLTFDQSGSTDSKRTTGVGVGYNSSEWSSSLTYNSADKTITTVGDVVWTTTKAAGTFESKEIDITVAFSGDADNIVTILLYETAAAGCYIKNPSVAISYTTETAYNVTFTETNGVTAVVTMNGTNVTSGTSLPNGTYEFSAKADGYKDYNGSFTVSGAAKEVTFTMVAKETWNYTVKGVDGESNDLGVVASGSAYESEQVTYYYPEFILSGTTLYQKKQNGSNPYWGTSATLDSNNKEFTVTYGDGTISDVVFYKEAEEIEGFTAKTTNNATIRCSNGTGGIVSGSVKLTTLPKGKYKIFGQVWGTTGLTAGVTLNGADVWALASTGSLASSTSEEFNVPAETDLYIYTTGGNDNHMLDLIYIVKTGDGDASLPVSVTAPGYATLVSDYALDFSSSSIKAYTVKVASQGVATLTEVGQVPAKTPVLLYAAGGATEDIPVIASATALENNDLVAGTGAAVATTDGDYTNMILNVVDDQVGFYFAADQTVAANRAYLHIATTLAPDAEAGAPMVIEFADEVTGIEAVEAETSASGIYNLAGQRVAKAQKGLYIVNGKKVIVK